MRAWNLLQALPQRAKRLRFSTPVIEIHLLYKFENETYLSPFKREHATHWKQPRSTQEHVMYMWRNGSKLSLLEQMHWSMLTSHNNPAVLAVNLEQFHAWGPDYSYMARK